MSATDKERLDGIDDGANLFVLPIAGNGTLGGVQINGNNLSIDVDGVLSATDTNTTYNAAVASTLQSDGITLSGGEAGLMTANDKFKLNGIADGANAFVLPIAGNGTLGGVQINGNNLSIDVDGVLSATDTNTTYNAAVASTLQSDGITLSGGEAGLMTANDKFKLDGIASGANDYSLPAATASVLGGIKVGTNLSDDGAGVLSLSDDITLGSSTDTQGKITLKSSQFFVKVDSVQNTTATFLTLNNGATFTSGTTTFLNGANINGVNFIAAGQYVSSTDTPSSSNLLPSEILTVAPPQNPSSGNVLIKIELTTLVSAGDILRAGAPGELAIETLEGDSASVRSRNLKDLLEINHTAFYNMFDPTSTAFDYKFDGSFQDWGNGNSLLMPSPNAFDTFLPDIEYRNHGNVTQPLLVQAGNDKLRIILPSADNAGIYNIKFFLEFTVNFNDEERLKVFALRALYGSMVSGSFVGEQPPGRSMDMCPTFCLLGDSTGPPLSGTADIAFTRLKRVSLQLDFTQHFENTTNFIEFKTFADKTNTSSDSITESTDTVSGNRIQFQRAQMTVTYLGSNNNK